MLASQKGLAFACEILQNILPEHFYVGETKPPTQMIITFDDSETFPQILITKDLGIVYCCADVLAHHMTITITFETILRAELAGSYFSYRISLK